VTGGRPTQIVVGGTISYTAAIARIVLVFNYKLNFTAKDLIGPQVVVLLVWPVDGGKLLALRSRQDINILLLLPGYFFLKVWKASGEVYLVMVVGQDAATSFFSLLLLLLSSRDAAQGNLP